VKMSERDTNTEEKHKEPRAWRRPWIPLRRQPWRWVLWAVMLVIALVALGWLVDNLYPGIWQEISGKRVKRVATLIGIGVALTVIIVLLVLGGTSLGWTGFREKKLWDWLQLLSALALPVVLAAAGFWFAAQQEERQRRIEGQRAQAAQKIEGQRADAERKLAEQRAQDEALQAYLDQMSQLMLERKLLAAEQGDPVHTLAQARTSTAILRLDAEHNESVTRFLIDSGLAESSEASPRLLREITLSHATLSDAQLPDADLSDADLSGADLSNALLNNANLSGASLKGASLKGAALIEADLGLADEVRHFQDDPTVQGLTDLEAANTDLSGADLSGANLSGADLSGADLSAADLGRADMVGTSLKGANLQRADLSKALLWSADLTGAVGITNEELEQQATSLDGATMPNGQKYEDWVKSTKPRG
jgi:uncharacterized protein YjbI with pentapeptide repeats